LLLFILSYLNEFVSKFSQPKKKQRALSGAIGFTAELLYLEVPIEMVKLLNIICSSVA
jgi:hypothetical protein